MIDASLTPGMLRELDRMSIRDIEATWGPGLLVTEYSKPFGHWTPGDGTPAVVADGPAEAQAMGRCVAHRTRLGREYGIGRGAIHPTECGWCAYPMAVLLVALDHAIVRSQHVASEYVSWDSKVPSEPYARPTGRAGEYRNPEWAEFWQGITPGTDKAVPSQIAYWSERRREAVERAASRPEPSPARDVVPEAMRRSPTPPADATDLDREALLR